MESDYLTCGQCLKEFPLQRITLFIQHKKLDCDEDTGNQFEDTDLKCFYCPRGFMSAWGLLVHVQLTHSLRIFVERTTLSLTTNPSKAVAVKQTEGILGRKTIIDKENFVTNEDKEGGVKLDSAEMIDSDILEIENKDMLCENPDDFGKVKNEMGNKTNATEKLESIRLKNNSNLNVSKDAVVGNKTIFMGKDVLSQSEEMHTSDLIISHSEESVESRKPLMPKLKSPVVFIRKDGHDTVSTPSSLSKNISPPAKIVQDTTVSFLSQAPLSSLPRSVTFPQENILRNPVSANSDAIKKTNTQNPTIIGNLVTMQKTNTQIPTVNDNPVVSQRTSTQNNANHRLDEGNNPDRMESVEPGNISGETDEANSDCCDNQGCGITVIPGSHLNLQKCCNAVLPKKRKRHMEMKHMPFSWSSSRYARRRMLQRSLASAAKSNVTGTSTIFIDVEPDSFVKPDKNQNTESHRGASMDMQMSDTSPDTKDAKRVPRLFPIGSESRTKSLILKPGAVFSIPFSYNIPNSVSGTSTSIPISIIQAQSGGKQVYSSSFTNRKLVPISTQKLSQGQIQVSRVERGNNGGSEGEIIIEDADFRRRKYPTSKPFQCDKCSMAFNQRIHLKKHMSKHTGIKPYKCGECDYSTVERSHLKVHIRIHTGEKPFKCTYCEYATAQNSTLKIHLKRHHGGKMFACQSCEKTFTQIEQLKGHVTDHQQIPAPSTPLKMKLPENDSTLLIDKHEKQSLVKEIVGEHESVKDVEPITSNEDLGHVLSIPEKD